MGPLGDLCGALTPPRRATVLPKTHRPADVLSGPAGGAVRGWYTHEFLLALLLFLISWKRRGGSHLCNSVYIISGISRRCKLKETADYVKHVLALWEYSSENTFVETKAKGLIGE